MIYDEYNNLRVKRNDYILLKLLLTGSFDKNEFMEAYSISERTARRMIQAAKETLYDIFNDDVQLIFDKKKNLYILIIYKSSFNIANLPLF